MLINAEYICWNIITEENNRYLSSYVNKYLNINRQ